MSRAPLHPRRRTFLLGALGTALAGCASWQPQRPERGPVAMLFPGSIEDGGRNQAAHAGLLRLRDELGMAVRHREGVATDRESMLGALRELAASDAELVIANGPEASSPIQRVAWEFPERRFASIDGNLLRPNLAIYAVEQAQSAWLAGAAAALLSRSGVVGHIGSPRDEGSLAVRAAFADGVRTANSRMRLLTRLLEADEPDAARRLALAQTDAGADVLFAAIGPGRDGAVQACRERGVKAIGHVIDWVAASPDVFIASAVGDPGAAVFAAGRDLHDFVFAGDVTRRLTLRHPQAVRLSLGESVPAAVRERVAAYHGQVASGRIPVADSYDGPEFSG